MSPTDRESNTPFLSARDVTLSFSGVRVVNEVGLDLYEGEVVALLGENGAGKSSLMKILAGVYTADQAIVKVRDEQVHIDSVRHARMHGISMVHQELNLIDNLSVAENIALGREPRWGARHSGVVDRRAAMTEAGEALAQVGSPINPGTLVRRLSIAQQQQVEIAKALAQHDVRVLLMDEPTSSLAEEQAQELVTLIKALRDAGRSIVITTHRIPEAFAVADRIVVLRDGRKVAEYDAHDPNVSRESVVNALVGRELTALFPTKRPRRGSEVIELDGISGGIVQDVSFSVSEGEIFGLGGLVGAGRTELARLVFGCDRRSAGVVRIDGVVRRIRSPRNAVRAGLGFVPEDRKREGLALELDIEKNLSLPNLWGWSQFGVLSLKALARRARAMVDTYRVRSNHHRQLVRTLSGGNQQKIVLAKWMATPKRVLLLDEPTRGVDVGARQEIYAAIDKIAATGVAVILISSDMEELIGMSDRIGVMAEGRLQGVLEGDEVTQARIFELASKLESVA
jgi:ribose transport system ATP-binding protein